MKTVTTDLTDDTKDLHSENVTLKRRVFSLESQVDKLEAQSCRSNLIFHGINGPSNENWDTSGQKVRSFISETLGLPQADTIDIERAHRLNPANKKTNQPIIVKFNRYKDREVVLKKAREILSFESNYGVSEDLTQRVRNARRSLKPFLTEAK